MSAVKKQTGVALITAMLVVSLAAILASALVSQLFLDIRRTANIFQSEQAYLYNINSENIARFTLLEDELFADTRGFDDLVQYSDNNEQTYPVPGGSIRGYVIDLQGRFNINNLLPTNTQNTQNALSHIQTVQRFRALLTALNINPNLHNELVDSLVDWIDDENPPNSQTLPQGAEYDYYIGLERPYRPANNLMTNATELRMVRGFNEPIGDSNETVYDRLKDHICVLPSSDVNININTASIEVFESIQNINANMAEQLIAARPYTNQSDFLSELNSLSTPPTNLTSIPGTQVNSEYFLLRSVAQIGENKVTMYSTIYRPSAAGTASGGRIRVIQRSIGKGTW